MKTHLIFLILCCGALLIAGCTTPNEQPPLPTTTSIVTTPATTVYPPPVNVTIAELGRYYRPEGGCYFGAQVEVTNTGQTPVTNIAIRLSLRDVSTGSIRDIQNLPLERMDTGERKVFTFNFDGDCSREYGIRADIS